MTVKTVNLKSDSEDLVALALAVAKDGAAVALEGYRSRPQATEKARNDLVTAYDLRSEACIVERLAAATPEIAVLAEEQGGTMDDGPCWLCDPLDGTTNFVHGHPFWAVSVGLCIARRPVLGAVVAPALGVEWCGFDAGSVSRNGAPCRVSSCSTLETALLATGFPADRSRTPENNLDAFCRVMKRVRGVRRCGSAAIDCCFVADGTYDGYWERRLNAWDLAAGCAIALAAGAKLTNLDGGEADISRGHIVLTNGVIHDNLLRILADEPP